MNRKISIIVAVYNVEAYLQKCIDSLLHQTYKNYEVILVDDGSTDSSGSICDEAALRSSRIKVIHKPNGGLSSARNYGITFASGAYVVFVDGDDIVTDNFLEVLEGALIDGAMNMSIVGLQKMPTQDLSHFDSSGGMKVDVYNSVDAIKLYLCNGGITESACGKLADISLWKGNPFPEGRVYEDLSIMAMVIGESNCVSNINLKLYGQVFRQGSITRKKTIAKSQFLDAFRAISDTCDYIESKYGHTLTNELLAFQALRFARMCRLYRDLSEVDSECKSVYVSSLSFLKCNFRKISRSGIIMPSTKAKVALIVYAPLCYEVLYRIHEWRKSRFSS